MGGTPTRALLIVPALAGLLAASCASNGGSSGAPSLDREKRYVVSGTVLEDKKHGPQLCGAVAESLPPQCSGAEVVGWDWDAVPHDSRSGTKWGDYTMIGTWDGQRFTFLEFTEDVDRPKGTSNPGDVAPTTLSTRELQAVSAELHKEFPLIFSSWVNEERKVVFAETYLATDELRSAVNDRFGDGVVHLSSWLQPVD